MALEYLMRRQVEEGASASSWRPPGLGPRLGVGGRCSLNFRRGADTSVHACGTDLPDPVWGVQKDTHPCACRASRNDGGSRNLSVCPTTSGWLGKVKLWSTQLHKAPRELLGGHVPF